MREKPIASFAHLPICPFAHLPICRFADLQICPFADLLIFLPSLECQVDDQVRTTGIKIIQIDVIFHAEMDVLQQ